MLNYFTEKAYEKLDKYITTYRVSPVSSVPKGELNTRIDDLEKDINDLIKEFKDKNDLVLYYKGRLVTNVMLSVVNNSVQLHIE